MAQSETVKELLRRLEEGTEEIYSRYNKLISASDSGYDSKILALEGDYQRAAGQVSAQAKINLKTTLEKMADAGYTGSGETVQATIAANATRASALSALSVQKAKDKKAYEDEKSAARTKLTVEGQKEASDFRNQMNQAVLDQTNLDREFEAQEKQREYERGVQDESLKLEKAMTLAKILEINAGIERAKEEAAYQREQDAWERGMKEQEFAYKKEQDAWERQTQEEETDYQREQDAWERGMKEQEFDYQKEKDSWEKNMDEQEFQYQVEKDQKEDEKEESEEKEEGKSGKEQNSKDKPETENTVEPEKSPYDYVDDIVERYTNYDKEKGYKVIDRKSILLAISAIVKDTKISYSYRYEMYVYAKSLGYVS